MEPSIVKKTNIRDKIIFVVLSIIFLILLGIAIYLFVQIRNSDSNIISIPTNTPGEVSPTSYVGYSYEDMGDSLEISSDDDNFTTLYPSKYEVKKDLDSSNLHKYTFTGNNNKTLIILTVNHTTWNDGNPNITDEDPTTPFAGTYAYVYATDKYFREDFKNKGIYYSLECVTQDPTLSPSCAVVFDNFKFTN